MTSNAQAPKLYAIVESDSEEIQVREEKDLLAKAYKYTPLPSKGDHIRLIELIPGQFDSPIRIKIRTWELESSPDKPDYYALSYTWNDPEHDNLIIGGRKISPLDDLRHQYNIRHPIWCDSEQILISTNLRDALGRLRDPKKHLTLWIDQLCINQDDLDERATQVVTMQRIYHEARGVKIWLGEHKNNSKLGIEFAVELQKVGEECLAGRTRLPGELESHKANEFGLPSFPQSLQWQAFVDLLRRPVFHRIWIVQEIVSARDAQVLCGDSPIFNYRVLVNALGFLQNTRWLYELDSKLAGGKKFYNYFGAVASIQQIWLHNPTLELREKQRNTLISTTRQFQATDPRDKIFALLPIINDYGHRDLYGEDAPKEFKASEDMKRRKGPIDRLLEDEEDAVQIIRISSDPYMVRLRESLVEFLQMVPRLLEPFLHPSPEIDLRKVQHSVGGEFDNLIKPMHDFMIHRSSSREDKEVQAFLENFYRDILSRLETFRSLLGQAVIPFMVQLSQDPEYIEDIEKLLERTNGILIRLVREQTKEVREGNKKGVSIRQLMAEGKIIVGEPVGGAPPRKEFHDWAWSARGSTVANYRKDAVAVYTEFTVKCLQDDKNLDLLCVVEDLSERKLEGLPSWVPDFSSTTSRIQLQATVGQGDRKASNYYASCGFAAEVAWNSDDPGTLGLDGYAVDRIKWLASTDLAFTHMITFQHILEWEDAINGLPGKYPTGENVSEAYWRMLVGDFVGERDPVSIPAPSEFGMYYDSFVAFLDMKDSAEKEGQTGSEKALARRNITKQNLPQRLHEHGTFMEESCGVMLQRRFCVTEGGLIGAVPVSAALGDELFVLKGANVPFVLRRGVEGRYKLVGECYVHGIMRGEKEGELEWRNIQLQ